VNNVGDTSTMPALDVSAAALSEMMAVNVGAGLELSRLAHPLMKANGKGVIVFNSSIFGFTVGGLHAAAYSASKGPVGSIPVHHPEP
jgi:Tropinone reductase 1